MNRALATARKELLRIARTNLLYVVLISRSSSASSGASAPRSS